jgi:hypothetical protein
MAGSIKWFVYTTDAGEDFALKLDESNTEIVNGGVQDFPDVPPTQNALPRNIKPRQLIYRSADGTVTRRVVALTQAIFANAETGRPSFTEPVNNAVVSLRRKEGEIVSLPFGVDTGLIDGDAT